MRQRNRDDDTAGVSEMKAFGEELLATGNRYIEAGKRWLNERRDEMTARNAQEAARRGPSSRSADPYPNHPADDGQERSAWLGSRADRDHLLLEYLPRETSAAVVSRPRRGTTS